jgi:copper oxidase (laccase) domain-containing protein
MAQVPRGALAAVGPAIGVCCYEIDEDLAGQFERKFGEDVVVRENEKKPHLDLVAVAAQQLQEAEIDEMELSHLCTACHPELFFSFRRDGSSGRQMSFIGLV